MLISYQWLKNYVPLTEPAETVVSRLVQAGVAVENLRHLGDSIQQVVVAELLAVEKHPQADRLSLTRVSTGTETFQVVCGAKNIAPGQKVPLAKVGAVLPGNFEIKAAKIRGVESFGMLCSAKELGLAEDAEGILILPPDAPAGASLLEYMGLPDTLIELEITPNRADLLSHLGVAREAGAIFRLPVTPPKIQGLLEGSTPASKLAQVSIEANDLCLLYTCRIIEGVKVGPSPKWLRQALERLGQRSINNVVDVTNYVLFETGQPLHSFDLTQLHGSRVIARRAKAGEKIPLLDNTERELKDDMLVIADADRPVALAGVMGGSNTQVTDQTQNILMESALFLPGSVRKTSRQLGISTDSSYRFERGVDPTGVKTALDRAAALILEVAGGSLAKGVLEVSTQSFPPVSVPFRPARANKVLGLELPAADQIAFLKALGCEVNGDASSSQFQVQTPSYRLDLTREIDLIEEIARMNGYDLIAFESPRIPSVLFPWQPSLPLEKEIRFTFQQAGIYEAVNSTFLPSTFPQKLKLDKDHPLMMFQEVSNPIADDQRALRPTLLASLLGNVQLNLSHQQESVALYEINKVFTPLGGGKVTERLQAAVVLSGVVPSLWHSPGRNVDLYDLKGLAESLMANCGLTGLQWEYVKGSAPYQPAQSFRVLGAKGETLLWGGAVHPKVLKEFDISAPCFALEVELGVLHGLARQSLSYVSLPKFPSAWRDIALVVPDGVTSAEVEAAIESMGRPELKAVRLFDLYRGSHLAAGFRSLAYRLTFQVAERTLTDQEVTGKVAKIVDHLKARYSIAIR